MSSDNLQLVSATALLLCQTFSSLMCHPMTNSKWVVLHYFFAWLFHQSCVIQWLTGSEWCCFISWPGSPIIHVSMLWPTVCERHCFILCKAVSSIMSHAMTNRVWVTPPHILDINHVSSHDQQQVCGTASLLCQAASSVISFPISHREWVTLLYSLQSNLISHVPCHD